MVTDARGELPIEEFEIHNGAPRRARHPAQVTVDRLSDHGDTYRDMLTPREMDALVRVRNALLAIAGGLR